MGLPENHPMSKVILELQHVALRAECSIDSSDHSDWRSLQSLNWIRAYGLLLRLASAMAFDQAEQTRGGSANRQFDADPEEAFRLLSVFAKTCELTPHLDNFDEKTTRSLSQVRRLSSRVGPTAKLETLGAQLEEDWSQPIPATMTGLLGGMAWPSTPDQRKSALQSVLDGPDCFVSDMLDEANIGVASVIHLAGTFDDCGYPRRPFETDFAYRRAALIRVLAAHRILLEILGLSDPLAIMSLLGLAEMIAAATHFTKFFTPDTLAQQYLASVREGAIASMEDSGRIESADRNPRYSSQITADEKAVVRALDVVVHSDT